MTTLQIPLTAEIQQKLDQRTKTIGISRSAYVKMLLAKDLLSNETEMTSVGNLFNANRDNNGKGIPLSDFKDLLNV